MPLDWTEVEKRYAKGAVVPNLAGGRSLEVTGVDDEYLHIKHRLWTAALARSNLERAVTMVEEGRLPRDARYFVEDYRAMVDGERGTSVAQILKELGHLD